MGMGRDALSQCLGRGFLGSLGLTLSLGEEDRPRLITLFPGKATSISIPPRYGECMCLIQACRQASPPPPPQSQLTAFVGIQSQG